MKKFCYRCGREAENLENGLCEECRESDIKRVKVTVILCPQCSRIKHAKVWKCTTIENFLKKRLKAEKMDFEKKMAETRKGKIRFEVKIKKEICPRCSKLLSGYHESVVQLRGFSQSDYGKIKIPFDHFLKETKHGTDVHFLNKTQAFSFVKKLKRTFKNLEIKKSYKLITVKDGKRVYRTYISVRKK